MENKNRSLHIFYGVAPLAVYLGLNFVVIFLAGIFQWSNGMLNVVAQLTNIIVLYVWFYMPYRQRQNLHVLPPLLPKGAAVASENKMPAINYVLIIILGVCCSLALNGWITILHLNETITTYQEVAENIYSGSRIAILIRTVLLASVLEEMLMRGLCYGGISHIFGRLPGMFLSSLLFGIIHGNLLQGLYAFILGVLFSYVYDMYDRRLFAPILAHISANIISVLGTTVPGVSFWIARYFYLLTLVSTILLVFTVIGIYLCKRHKDIIR